jgi:glutamate dehydrogenase
VVAGRAERNRILAEMTDEVASLVLADNQSQALGLTLDGLRSAARYEEFVALIDDMAGAGVLSRADESVPTREELLAADRSRGLPRPLLAVLLGHTKMYAFEMLLETDFPDGAAGRPFLDGYFPRRLRESFAEHFQEHRLRREIVATGAVNHVVNCAGIAFLPRMMALGCGLGEAVAAYLEASRASAASGLRERILAAPWPAPAQHEALLELERALEALVRQLREGQRPDAGAALAGVRRRLEG